MMMQPPHTIGRPYYNEKLCTMYYLLKPSPYIPLCLIYGHSTAYVEGNKVNISPGNAVDCTVGPTHIHCEHLEERVSVRVRGNVM